MRTRPALAALTESPELDRPNLDEAIRTLVELIEKVTAATGAEVFSTSSTSEEVLVDREVDGARYLLLRIPRPGGKRIQLSPREQEIVRMVAKGHPNKVIADVLNISSWTVCTHLRRIFAKLGVGSRAAMVARLLEIGVLTTENRFASQIR